MKVNLALSACGALLSVSLPVLAHHAFSAEYDSQRLVEVKGVVTKVEWTNPHAHFYVDVKDESGKVTNWNLELGSPNMLIRNGWKRTSLKAGDEVTVKGSGAKDGANLASASTILFPDGHKLGFLSADDNGPGTSKQ